MRPDAETVSDLGERALVDRIVARFPGPPGDEVWAGDDAAVVDAPRGRLLYTIDSLVEGVDFDAAYATGADVGWKALAMSVSDIAAMGGSPIHAVTALWLPGTTPLDFVDALADGLAEAATEWDVRLVGGDIGGGSEIGIAVAVVGSVETAVVGRRGARVEDAICVTGRLGGAAGGLVCLRRGMRRGGAAETDALIERHLRPIARVTEGIALAGLGATAMIDVSDGLAVDLWRVMTASATGCDVDVDAVPIDPALSAIADVDPRDAALFGGEDFELLFTIDGDRVEDARAALGEMDMEVTRIGAVTDGDMRLGGDDLTELKERAWEHLRDR